ncbi:MAG: hypothetical protein ACPGGK_05150 [Pikeienuella sp.]
MSWVITGDVNKAHEQAMDLLGDLTKTQKRTLSVITNSSLSEKVRCYGVDTYSGMCSTVRDSAFVPDEVLPKKNSGITAWKGTKRITGVTSFYIVTNDGNDNRFDANVRPFSKEIVIFRCYSLVSRAGTNVCHVEADRYGGALVGDNVHGFDYERSDGGLAGLMGIDMALRPFVFGTSRFKSYAEYRLSGSARSYHLRNYSEDCYDIDGDDERTEMIDSVTAWNGRTYQISAKITGRHHCSTEMVIGYKPS